MALVVLALGSMNLTGCETEGDPDTTDKFKGKTWKSGPDGSMWNVWTFTNEVTFQFSHYHSADDVQDNGEFTYYVEDSVLYVTALSNGSKGSYAVTFAGDGKSFTITSEAPHGGSKVYTQVEKPSYDYTYKFKNDGTYEYLHEGVHVHKSGSYIVRDDVLVLLENADYTDAASANSAVKKYTFIKTDGAITLTPTEGEDPQPVSYGLNGGIPSAITLTDKLSGKNWKTGTGAPGTGMYNWYGFRSNGTYHYYHYMSNKADYVDRGDFSYLVQDDILITLSASDSPSKNPASPSYTVSVYTLTFSEEDNKVSFLPASGSAVDLTKFDGHEGFPPASGEHHTSGDSSGEEHHHE
jgi:hypothetical protein